MSRYTRKKHHLYNLMQFSTAPDVNDQRCSDTNRTLSHLVALDCNETAVAFNIKIPLLFVCFFKTAINYEATQTEAYFSQDANSSCQGVMRGFTRQSLQDHNYCHVIHRRLVQKSE